MLCQWDNSLCHTLLAPELSPTLTPSLLVKEYLASGTGLHKSKKHTPTGPFTSIAASPPPLLSERQNSNHLQFTDQTSCNCPTGNLGTVGATEGRRKTSVCLKPYTTFPS